MHWIRYSLFVMLLSSTIASAQIQPAFKDVVYATVNGKDLLCDIYMPLNMPAKAPEVIVWIHGGAWMSGSKENCRATPLVAWGFAVVSINYRLSQEAIFPAQIHDCKAAIRWIRANAAQYGLDASRIGAWGSSAGGHLVAMLGTSNGITELEGDVGGNLAFSSDVQAVCDWFGPSNLLTIGDYPSGIDHNAADSPEGKLIGGAIPQNQQKAWLASPIAYVDPTDPPFLIHHGTADMTVPFHQSVELDSMLKLDGVDVTFHPLDGAGHGTQEFSDPRITTEVAEFFNRTLRGTTGIENPGKADEFQFDLYPNPASDMLSISAQNSGQAHTVTIASSIGKVLYRGDLTGNEACVDLRAFPAGVYFVHVSGASHFAMHRFVKK